jgi:hypothetical protein
VNRKLAVFKYELNGENSITILIVGSNSIETPTSVRDFRKQELALSPLLNAANFPVRPA